MSGGIGNHIRSNVIGYAALFFALTAAPAWGATIGSSDIEPNAVLSKHIKDGQVRSSDIGAGQVKGVHLGLNAVTAPKLAARAVTTPKLAPGAVKSSSVADNGLTGADVNEATFGLVPNAHALDGIGSGGFWKLAGNSGTTSGDFLGTTDNQPLNLRVNDARGLRLEPASDGTNQSPNVIGGIADNTVTAGVHSGTIAGGGRSLPGDPTTANRVTDSRGSVGGGANNQAGDGAGTTSDREFATVAGGISNTASGTRAAVGGGEGNTASGAAAAIPGGVGNNATQSQAVVGGGTGNNAVSAQATVAGGLSNTASDEAATVGGGQTNTAANLAATVGGGNSNNASGTQATVSGGILNSASGSRATVPGGVLNTAPGIAGFASGAEAHANDNDSFVWSDGQAATNSAGANSFVARASGGFTFYTATNNVTGATLASGSGSWASLSDRHAKDSVRRVSNRDILRKLGTVPVRTWRYKAERGGVRHIGPMAQDFYRAFGVGEDDRHISSVDADGVALAGIKGLYRELQADRRRQQEQDRRINRLEDHLAALEREGG